MSEEKSGQLIECVNPEHKNLGSIHYIQPDCVAKIPIYRHGRFQCLGNGGTGCTEASHDWKCAFYKSPADSDESWQASEALLKR